MRGKCGAYEYILLMYRKILLCILLRWGFGMWIEERKLFELGNVIERQSQAHYTDI